MKFKVLFLLFQIYDKYLYSCEKCEKTFATQKNLKGHIQSFHENLGHKCYKCDKTFAHHSTLHVHFKTIHLNIQYKCDKCEKIFSRKTSLNRHIRHAHLKKAETALNIKQEYQEEDESFNFHHVYV